jgi:hypothetical protein
MAKQRSMKQIKIFEKIFNKKQTEKKTEVKEPNQKLPASDYDGMGDFSRFGRP